MYTPKSEESILKRKIDQIDYQFNSLLNDHNLFGNVKYNNALTKLVVYVGSPRGHPQQIHTEPIEFPIDTSPEEMFKVLQNKFPEYFL